MLRAAIAQAAHVLADEGRDLAERVRQARALLIAALETTDALSPGERAALDADPGVRAALARLAAGDEVYLLAGPDGGPSDEPLEATGDECEVGPEDLTRLGL
jgi:hypothetical protein